ncbi:MAG: hypothetical protein KA764_10390 [Anaerolineales bacterium]|nr:hypothetical protein [Anaerolineales bacterium]
MDTQVSVRAEDLAALLQKMDALTVQVGALTEQVEAQRRGTQALEEMVHELTPVFNQGFKTVVRELDEVGDQFTAEELVYLVKRLLANTQRFNTLLIQLEAGLDLLAEVQLLSKPVFDTAVHTMDHLDRRGYFVFAQEGARMADRIVTEFTPADARALSDNIVTILKTVKNMTQPDIMALANNAVDQLHEPAPAAREASVWSLLRDLNDPQVRTGLARLLRVLKTFSSPAEPPAAS